MSKDPTINFFIDKDLQYPASLDNYWEWQVSTPGVGKWWGIYHWVLQTYLVLKDEGVNCRLVQ